MATLGTSTQFMLPPGLPELHRQTLEWESNLCLWKEELDIFTRLILKYRHEVRTRTQIQELNHMRFLLDYYSNELLPILEAKIASQKAQLRELMGQQGVQDEWRCRHAHAALAKQIATFEEEFVCLRNELYALLEKAVTRIKSRGEFSEAAGNGISVI